MENLNLQGLLKYIGSGSNLLYIVTTNERRMEGLVALAAARIKDAGSPFFWSCTEGLTRDGAVVPDTIDPLKALDFVMTRPEGRLFLFRDLPMFWGDNPFLIRRLKDFATGGKGRGKVIIVIGNQETVPDAIREETTILQQGLPVLDEIRTFLESLRDRDPLLKQALGVDPELLGRLVVASRGLDLNDIERGVRMLRLSPKAKSDEIVEALHMAKREIIQASGIMEYVLNDSGPDHVGGMDNLKHWMVRREKAFGIENIASGVNLPKGILIMGVAGCGKSLFVKAIAAQWRLPLIRLDMAAVYAGYFGTPESSLRKALKTAEAIAPCVLWIDEIESGISSQGFKAEGGSASRILGTFLTWMQEKNSPVFVAATANAIEMLPAEVLRKGRFDEIFYVGLPDGTAREEIFRIHLAKRRINPALFDLPLLAGSTKGFSGAEIEQAVMSATFESQADRRTLSQQDVMAAASRTVPLSVTMAEQIKKIETWAFKRAVPASGKFSV